MLQVGDDRDDGLVDVVLFCCGDSFKEDLCWEPRLGVFVDLVKLDDVANGGVALFKTVEALRGTFFFSTSVELKPKDAGGGGASCEIIDSNTSLPSILCPGAFNLKFILNIDNEHAQDFSCLGQLLHSVHMEQSYLSKVSF